MEKPVVNTLLTGQEGSYLLRPPELEPERITLKSGVSLTLRAARPGDVLELVKMHARLSDESIYDRYLRPYRPSLEELYPVCCLPASLAWVASLEPGEPRLTGLAYAMIQPGSPTLAEPAVLVEDSFQGQGVGKQLLVRLARAAVEQGITTFLAYVRPQNRAMIHIIQTSGLPSRSQFAGGLREMYIDLTPLAPVIRR